MSRVTFPPKLASEKLALEFDFTSRLAASETISTKSVVAVVYSGSDPTPQNLIFGSATASGQVVTQLVRDGVLGVMYEVTCTITTSAGQTLQLAGYLAVVPNLE